MHRLRQTAAALAAIVTFATVGTAAAAPTPGELKVGVVADISTLDPQLMTNITDASVSQNINEGLVRFKLGNFEIEPLLAKSWSVSQDGLTWTFELVDNATFHKGYGPLTADDVVFTFERLTGDALKAPNRRLIGSFASISATGPHAVEIKLSAPDPSLLVKLAQRATAIVSKKAVEEKGAGFALDPIGTGPYQFDSRVTGQSVLLVKNPDYWGTPATLDKVTYTPVPDSTTLQLAFEAGDLDMIPVEDSVKLAEYEANPELTVQAVPGLWTRFIGFKDTVAPFDNPKVREAITYAIDRENMVDNLFKGLSTLADGIFAPAVLHRTPVVKYSYDPEKAKALLAEAGLADGFSVDMMVPNTARFIDPATAVQADLAKVGIKINVVPVELNTFITTLSSEQGYPMYLLARGQDPTPDRVIGLWFLSSSIPTTNWARISDPEIDAWVKQGLSTMDEAVRADVFAKAQEKFFAYNGYYFIDHENSITVHHNWVKNFVNDARNSIRIDKVTIEP